MGRTKVRYNLKVGLRLTLSKYAFSASSAAIKQYYHALQYILHIDEEQILQMCSQLSFKIQIANH